MRCLSEGEGEMEIIDELFSKYTNDLFRFIYSFTLDVHQSEDILQETFYKAYIAIDSYTGESIKPWLFTIAKNTCMDYFRKQKRIVISEDNFFLNLKDNIDIENDYLFKETFSEIIAIIEKLPKDQKKALTLKVFKNFTYEEGANIMGMKMSKFKTLVFRARTSIKNQLKR